MRVLTLARDLKRRKSREKHSLFVAEGVRSVEELAASPLEIVGVLAAPQLSDAPRGVRLREMLAERHVEVTAVSEIEFRSAAETESPQGVLAIAKIPEYSLSDIAARARLRILVLDAVQDPGNVGTILRTAAALSVDATVALPGTVDVWNAKVVRAAMGASFRAPVLQCSPDELFEFLDAQGIELWGAEMDGVAVGSADAPGKLALAVGNEGAGLSSNVRAKSSRLVSLPISSAVESLNVSVATGILLYQLRKE
ncbi:MAG TPA: RNA methyltransferase [Gemmatimonadaceae bacterium]|nr:RNA methyltransferase [Gemmatimonadaceae bacterium]